MSKCNNNINNIKSNKDYLKFFEYISHISERYELQCIFDNKSIILKKENLNIKNTDSKDKIPIDITFDDIKLPPNLKVYHFNIIINNYPEQKLSDNLYIQKRIIIKNSPKLHYFGKNNIMDQLIATKSFIKKIDDVKAKSLFCINESNSLVEISNIKTKEFTAFGCGSLKKLSDIQATNCDLRNCYSLKELSNLHIDHHLNLKNCTSLKKIDSSISIKSILNVDSTGLTNLPILNLATLDISNTKIKKLAPQTIITESLYATASHLKKLPDHMDLEGLFINGCKKLKKLGKNLKVHTLSAKDSGLRSLPNNLFLKSKDNNIAEVIISSTKIKKIPTTIKGQGKIITGNLLIENIHKFYDNKNIFFYISDKPIFLISNKKLDKNLEFEKVKKYYIKIQYQYCEQYIKNTLLFNSTNTIERKLLLEQFDKITNKEIEYIKNSHTTKNNKKLNLLNEEKKQFIHNEFKFNLIDYCRSKQAYEFLYQNGYHFTDEEYQIIKTSNLKNLYEMYLLKYNMDLNK